MSHDSTRYTTNISKYVLMSQCMHKKFRTQFQYCVNLAYNINFHKGAQLDLFGSSANGFGSYKSDLDICLTLPELTLKMVELLYIVCHTLI